MKVVILRSNWKILHSAKFCYTTSGCDGCDKYQVWCTSVQLRSSQLCRELQSCKQAKNRQRGEEASQEFLKYAAYFPGDRGIG